MAVRRLLGVVPALAGEDPRASVALGDHAVRETALMRLGSQVSRFAAAPIGGVDVDATPDITERMALADDDRLAPAWAEVVDRIMKLERRVPQSHRTRASLKWLRRWEVWIGEEMRRRAARSELTLAQMVAIVQRMQAAAAAEVPSVVDLWCTCDVPTRPFCGCGQCGECAGAPPPPECAACDGRMEWS
jgi:hypothetical protein